MAEPTLTCPKCKTKIKLTESLAAPIIEAVRSDYEHRLAQKDVEIIKREEALSKAQKNLDKEVADKLKQERTKIIAEEARKAELKLSTELERKEKVIVELEDVLRQRDTKLAEAQKAQAELIKKQRELDDAKREFDLTLEKRVQEKLETTREQARKEAEEHLKLKVGEKDKAMSSMQKQIDAFKQKDAEMARREEDLLKAKEKMDQQIAETLSRERAKISSEEARKARATLSTDMEQKAREIADLQEVLKQRDTKLAEAQKAQAELIKKQRELDDMKRELDLTVEKRIQEGLAATRDQARKEVEEQMKLKVIEKEQTITSMQKQIEELKRRAEQGSQQLQGEVQELELEASLRSRFSRDIVEPVPKGEHGGDVIHRVVGPLGQQCGTILWESKRTKSWSDGWLPKLRDDQRAAKAELAVIVSQVLPKGVDTFELIEGVWVAHPRVSLPLAMALRQSLIEVGLVRQASYGQQTKMEMVYEYLTGPRFRQRIQAIVEAFSSMQEDLEKEKKAITKQWAKREEEIGRVMQASVGMYGDLQGIAGKTLQEIEGLELRTLDAPRSKISVPIMDKVAETHSVAGVKNE